MAFPPLVAAWAAIWMTGALAAPGTAPAGPPDTARRDAPPGPVFRPPAPPLGGLDAARAAEQEGDLARALALAEGVVAAYPRSPVPRLEVVRLLLAQGGELPRAEAHLDAAQALAPDNPRGHYLRALLEEARGRPLRARAAYAEALRLRPSYEEARFRAAGLAADTGDWLLAEHHYRALVQLRPGAAATWVMLARALEAQGRAPEAVAALEAFRRTAPGNVPVTRALADLLERTGEGARAQALRDSLAPRPRPKRALPPSRR